MFVKWVIFMDVYYGGECSKLVLVVCVRFKKCVVDLVYGCVCIFFGILDVVMLVDLFLVFIRVYEEIWVVVVEWKYL